MSGPFCDWIWLSALLFRRISLPDLVRSGPELHQKTLGDLLYPASTQSVPEKSAKGPLAASKVGRSSPPHSRLIVFNFSSSATTYGLRWKVITANGLLRGLSCCFLLFIVGRYAALPTQRLAFVPRRCF